jgi:hypothetical protein
MLPVFPSFHPSFHHLPLAINDDHEVVLEAIQVNHNRFLYVADALRNDPEVIRAAVMLDGGVQNVQAAVKQDDGQFLAIPSGK